MNTHNIELPPLVGTLAGLPDRHREVIEAYGRACARAAIAPYQQRIAELESQLEAIGAGGVSSQPNVQPAAPAQETSDSEIMWEWAITPNTGDMRVDLSVFARALLARYGQPVEPEGWQLVPKEPTSKQLCHIAMRVSGADEDGVYRTDKGDWFECVDKAKQAYQQALETAPKFGEEE